MLSPRNKKSTTSGIRHSAALLPALGTGLSLLSALAGIPAARSAEAGFQPYKDASAGFALAKPEGWHVRNEGASIWVESPDKSELLLTQVFHAEDGETAGQWLQQMGDKFAAQFPQAQMDHLARQQAKGDEIVARMHYQGPQGAAQLRVLCSIVNGKGLLCVMAAPNARFTAEQPKLLHVAKSLRFIVSRGGQSGGNSGNSGGGGEGGASTVAQIKTIDRSIHWVTWTDPREHAFSTSVPKGWTVQGGTIRDQGGNPNFCYTVTSPNNDTAVVVGNPAYIGFTAPSQLTRSWGWQEGTHGVLHYMRAPEFNEWYLNQVISKMYDGVKVVKGQELEQVSEQLTRNQQQIFGEGAMGSVGSTIFKCTDKKTGTACIGAIVGSTTRMVIGGGGEPTVTWSAITNFFLTKAGDAKEAARVQTAMAVFNHVTETLSADPTWSAQRNQQSMDKIKAQGAANMARIAAAGERSKQIAANSSAALDAIMGRSNSSSQGVAGSAPQNAFANYLGNRTAVTDGSGNTYNVGSGHSHYYKGKDGTILGTDSAYSPGVDFTPMTEQ